MAKPKSTAIERLGRAKAKSDPSFDLNAFIEEREAEGAKRSAAIKVFAQKVTGRAGLQEHNLAKMAAHFFYGALCPPLQSEAALKEFARFLNSGSHGLPHMVLDRWVWSEYAQNLVALSLFEEAKRLAREDGADISEWDFYEPPPRDASPYFHAALISPQTEKARGEYYSSLDQAEQFFRDWLQSQFPPANASIVCPKPTRAPGFPDRLPQHTFFEARAMATAISDGRDGRNWQPVEGALAMLHDAKSVYKMQTRFEPGSLLLGWWSKSTNAPELDNLKAELQTLDLNALITFFVCLSGVLENPELDTTLDDIIAAIGCDSDARRSTKAREEWRAKVWRWLLLFDSLAVIGARPGIWKEPANGENKRERIDPQKLYSKDALIKIIGQRGTEQNTLDNSAIPKEVVLVAGSWARQWRGNREMLAEFGTLRAIASIPRGKPSGAWAACIGLMLRQRWREQAAKCEVTRKISGGKKTATQKFRPFTRRALLMETWRSDNDVMKILESDTPRRAKTYWNQAIKILQSAGVIGVYRESESLKAKPYGWQDAWLDQPLDIRPTGDDWKDAIKINELATEAKKRARKTPAKPTKKAA
jgi:hypothetical protein